MRKHLDQPPHPLTAERCPDPAMALQLCQSVQGSPKSFGDNFRVPGKRLNNRHHSSERVTQDLRRVGLRKPKAGRQNEHGLVQRWSFECEIEIGRGDGFDSLFWSRTFADRRPQGRCQFPETLERDRSNNGVAIFEMGIKDGLAVFDLLRQASDGD